MLGVRSIVLLADKDAAAAAAVALEDTVAR